MNRSASFALGFIYVLLWATVALSDECSADDLVKVMNDDFMKTMNTILHSH